MDMQTFERLRPSFPFADLVFLQGWGEPLLHPKFWEMMRQAKAAGAMTGFTTNATLLDQAHTLQLIQSGVDIMAVSLAGVAPATHERFRPGCGFTQIDGALGVLKELKRERRVQKPHVHIAFMLLRSNWEEVDGLVDLAARWGATQVVVSNLTWIGTEALQEESILANSDLWPEVTRVLERARRDASGRGIEFCYRDPGTGQPRATCTENVHKACFVSYRGDVSPCVFTNFSVSSGEGGIHYFEGRAHKVQRLAFGNVREEMLPAIWNSEAARGFRKSFQSRLAMPSPGTDHLPEPCRHCYKLLER
jgi:MoaA/NifB/PqqE/SkfB family radical SAM enzyme